MIPNPSTYKVVMLGDTSVGKTCIVARVAYNKYEEGTDPTIGSSFIAINKIVDSSNVTLHVFDTAGQERFRNLTRSYLRQVNAAIITYSIDCRSSFDSVENWRQDLLSMSPDASIYLVASKCDIYNNSDDPEKLISESDGDAKAQNLHALFMKVSAKYGENIDELFQQIAYDCYYKSHVKPNQEDENVVDITKKSDKKDSQCC